MVTNYGWLMVYGNIDRPSVEKHGGDVYIHKDDVVDGELAPGDIVTFYLYVDEKGLGAEFCQVEEKASARQGFNPEATPFMPSIPKPAPQSQSFKLNAAAKDFMPAVTCNDMLWRLSQVFDSDDEDESEDESEFDVTKPWKAPSSEGSTRGGETSDSEEESSCGGCSDSETESCPVKPESLTYVSVRHLGSSFQKSTLRCSAFHLASAPLGFELPAEQRTAFGNTSCEVFSAWAT